MTKLPTINIKGSEYVLVKDRVVAFNQMYPNGSIVAELVSDYDSKLIVMKSTVTPDTDKPARKFVDYSQAVIGDGMVNKTAALENASTSATGRALAMMGIGVVDSIASVDEIHKATGSEGKYPDGPPRSEKAIGYLNALKQQITMLFRNLDYGPEDMKTFISDLIGKETIDTIEEAQAIKSEVEAEQQRVKEL